MEHSGTIDDTGLIRILQELHTSRASGTLECTRDGETATLLLLIGTLFHAHTADNSAVGESLVVDVLTWNSGSYAFTEEHIVPAEETVRATIDELYARAQLRKSMRAREA